MRYPPRYGRIAGALRKTAATKMAAAIDELFRLAIPVDRPRTIFAAVRAAGPPYFLVVGGLAVVPGRDTRRARRCLSLDGLDGQSDRSRDCAQQSCLVVAALSGDQGLARIRAR